MTPSRAIPALLILAALLLAAGCAEKSAVTHASTTIATPTPPISDKELAEQSIDDAQVQIDKTDTIIGWFRSNASTRDDPQLPAIITKREIALSYLVTAEEEIANGNYEQARDKAQDAYSKANESYNDGLKRQQSMFGSPPGNCRPKLPFDQTFCILLVGFIPVLLSALMYSLMKTNMNYLDKPFLHFMGPITGFIVFTGASLLNMALLTGAKILNISPFRQWTVLVLVPWMLLMLYLILISVIVLGDVMTLWVRSAMNRETELEKAETRLRGSLTGKTGLIAKIIGMILLILVMLFVLYLEFLIAYPFKCL